MKFSKSFVGCAALVLTTISTPASAQKPGTNFLENPPSLPSKVCRKVSDKLCPSQLTENSQVTPTNEADDAYPVDTGTVNCVIEQSSVTLDADQRTINAVGTKNRCVTKGKWNTSVCSTATECTKVCGLEGDSYENVKTQGDELTLILTPETGPRVIMLDATGKNYKQFHLLNQEFTFDVDMAAMPCGSNGALYFVKMDADGGTSRYPNNTAGAKYGTGYCDAQCQKHFSFVDGEANLNKSIGSCCTEVDIWEANRMATLAATHACTINGQEKCIADEDCGGANVTGWCDKPGCTYNPFRLGSQNFYGPGKNFKIDTTRPFTVITQFVTHDNTATGELVEIRRLYKQDNRVVNNANTTWEGLDISNSITDATCNATKAYFKEQPYKMGDLATIGKHMIGGMTLVMSIWVDYGSNMTWLDSHEKGANLSLPGAMGGPCPNPGGHPTYVYAESKHTPVKFSNIRSGDFHTTY